MEPAEILRDGSLRLKSGGCVFLYTRLKPGVLLTNISGYDIGGLEEAPLELIAAEHRRFAKPVEWFVNAGEAVNVSNQVFRRWIDWLSTRRHLLKGMHVLTATQPTKLTVEIARHLSNTKDLMRLYDNRAQFEAAIAERAPGCSIPTDRAGEAASGFERLTRPDGTVEIRDQNCSFVYRQLSASVVLTTVSGADTGGLGLAALDEMETYVDRSPQSLAWFLDASRTREVANHVTVEWAEWLGAHQRSFQRIGILAGSGAYMPLIVTVAKFRSQSGDLIQIYREEGEFREAIAKRIPLNAKADGA